MTCVWIWTGVENLFHGCPWCLNIRTLLLYRVVNAIIDSDHSWSIWKWMFFKEQYAVLQAGLELGCLKWFLGTWRFLLWWWCGCDKWKSSIFFSELCLAPAECYQRTMHIYILLHRDLHRRQQVPFAHKPSKFKRVAKLVFLDWMSGKEGRLWDRNRNILFILLSWLKTTLLNVRCVDRYLHFDIYSRKHCSSSFWAKPASARMTKQKPLLAIHWRGEIWGSTSKCNG